MKDITNSMRILRATRKNYLGIIDSHDLTSLNYIPPNFNNNIIWNFGHVIATQQLLTYALSGLATPMSKSYIDKYRKGTKPENRVNQDELNELIGLSESLLIQFENDFSENKFQNYNPYKTSYGYEITSLSDAVEFNNVHEGMHLGTCIAIKKLVD